MKRLVLLLFCLTSPFATAALLPSDNVTLPTHSPIAFLGINSENGAYHFKGQAKLNGLLTAGWVKESVSHDGKIIHRLELHFFPEVTQVALLPSLITDDYETADKRMIVLSNSEEESKKLVEQYFTGIPASFFGHEEGVLKQPVSAILEGYNTYIECDSRYYIARLVSVEKIKKNNSVLVKSSGCGSEYAIDMYRTQSKDGYVNLRAKPNAKSDVLRQMRNDETLEKINTSGNWLYVKLYQEPNIIGYVHKSQIVAED